MKSNQKLFTSFFKQSPGLELLESYQKVLTQDDKLAWISDADGEVLFVSPSLLDLGPYSKSELEDLLREFLLMEFSKDEPRRTLGFSGQVTLPLARVCSTEVTIVHWKGEVKGYLGEVLKTWNQDLLPGGEFEGDNGGDLLKSIIALGDLKLAKEMIHLLPQSVEPHLWGLKEAIQKGHRGQIAREAHSIRSAICYLGPKDLMVLCSQMESCSQTSSFSDLRLLWEKISEEYKCFLKIVQRLRP